MIIHFIRHTRPDIESGICYGQTDLDVASTFPEEQSDVFAKLFDRYNTVYSSPLQRCTKLARELDTEEFVMDDRLKEYNFGDWELKPWREFNTPETKLWMDNFVHQAAPNGEAMLDMRERVLAIYNEMLASKSERIAVVTHSGVQRLIFAEVFNIPWSRIFRLQIDFAAVFELTVHQRDDFISFKIL